MPPAQLRRKRLQWLRPPVARPCDSGARAAACAAACPPGGRLPVAWPLWVRLKSYFLAAEMRGWGGDNARPSPALARARRQPPDSTHTRSLWTRRGRICPRERARDDPHGSIKALRRCGRAGVGGAFCGPKARGARASLLKVPSRQGRFLALRAPTCVSRIAVNPQRRQSLDTAGGAFPWARPLRARASAVRQRRQLQEGDRAFASCLRQMYTPRKRFGRPAAASKVRQGRAPSDEWEGGRRVAASRGKRESSAAREAGHRRPLRRGVHAVQARRDRDACGGPVQAQLPGLQLAAHPGSAASASALICSHRFRRTLA
eukprot:364635-Chlamydomonas_euryale.AAC.13